MFKIQLADLSVIQIRVMRCVVFTLYTNVRISYTPEFNTASYYIAV
jgi:hypothetical protein